jgi:AraC-like DNA-binding protein
MRVYSSGKRQPTGYRFATPRYEQFQIIYVCRGELVFEGSGHLSRNRPLGPGGVVILRQSSRFRLSCPRVGYEGVCFVATGELPEPFIGRAEPLQATAELRTLGQLMERQLESPLGESKDILVGLGRTMAWESIRLTRPASDSAPDSPAELARTARQVIDATLYSNIAPREALAQLPLSYRQLSRHFQDVFGTSPKRYQLLARLDEARRLLLQTRLSVTDIAMELGYSSSQHFATQFRRHTGQSPSDCRRESPRLDSGVRTGHNNGM